MIWLILGLGCFLYCQWAPSEESVVENYWLKGDTLLIRISDGTGWRLDIYREGRGSIRYGRHPNNMLTFENASFQFETLQWQLAADTKKQEKTTSFRSAKISYLLSHSQQEQTEILRDIPLGKELFSLAFYAGLNQEGNLRAKRRMLKLFRSKPPFG